MVNLSGTPDFQLANHHLDFETTIKRDASLGYFMHVIGQTVTSQGPLGFANSLEGDDDVSNNVQNRRKSGEKEQGQNNRYEGFYIDDIIIGFAERGETVLNAPEPPVPVDADEDGELDPLPPTFLDYGLPPSGVSPPAIGEYQLEIRSGEDYGIGSSQVLNIYYQFDTNDRMAEQITILAPPSGEIGHGDSFTISDGVHEVEFRLFDAALSPGGGEYVAITFQQGDSAGEIANRIAQAINATTWLDVTAGSIDSSERVDLFGATSVVGLPNLVFGMVEMPDSPDAEPVGYSVGTSDGTRLDPFRINSAPGDTNLFREKGQIIIDSNWITGSAGTS